MAGAADEAESSGLLAGPDGNYGSSVACAGLPPKRRSCRYRVALLAGVGYTLAYAQRLVLPIGIVRMQDEFGWSKAVQGQLLGSFFIGYAIMMPIGGMVASIHSPGRAAGLGMLTSSLLLLAMPAAARWGGSPLLGALRIAQGLLQGVIWPGFAAIWTKWAPPDERSTMSSFPQAGGYVGNVLFGAIIGAQCDRDEALLFGGWVGAFDLTAVLGLLWALAWLCLVSDSPAQQRQRTPTCSAAECSFVERALGDETARAHLPASNSGARPGLRFFCRALATPSVLAICAASWSVNIAFYILQNAIPAYTRDMHGLSFTSIGFITAVPQVFLVAMIILAVNIDLKLRANAEAISPRTIRRVLTCAGIFANGLFFVGMGVGTLQGMGMGAAISLFIGGYCILGLPVGAGFGVNHLDISPNAAGVIVGITNTFGSIAGVVAPWAMGSLTSESLPKCDQPFYKPTVLTV